ncbi:hypothetical protein C3L33_05825, partial [Rhododendron williamsianum]
MNAHGGGDVPKVADFLGVSCKSDQSQSDLVSYNEIQGNESDHHYLFSSNSLVPLPLQETLGNNSTPPSSYEFQESSSNLQSLTLSMGSGSKGLTSETGVENTFPRSKPFGWSAGIDGQEGMKLISGITVVEGKDNQGKVAKVQDCGYDKEDKAARAYDLAALKYWGTSTTTNFPISNYEKEVEEMKHMTRQEFVASIRRHTYPHECKLDDAGTEEEAAEAYDIAAIKFRGLSAVTNFDMNRYDVKAILESNTLPIGGGAAKRLKEAQAIESSRKREEMMALTTNFQNYPLLLHQQQAYEQPQPLLSLQNHEISPYGNDPAFQQNYIQTQLQLNQSTQFYNGYFQGNPGLFHGLMGVGGSSSSVMENNGSSSGSYGGGYFGNNGLGMGLSSNSGTSVGGSGHEELALVKVDYDMPSSGYGGWAGDSEAQS